MNGEFWDYIQELVDRCPIIIDRPKGTIHPHFPSEPYPVDYGYLEGTSSIDAGGVDIWVGSLSKHKVVGIQCSVDLYKKDTELKILMDCTDEEIDLINHFDNTGQMRTIYIKAEKRD